MLRAALLGLLGYSPTGPARLRIRPSPILTAFASCLARNHGVRRFEDEGPASEGYVAGLQRERSGGRARNRSAGRGADGMDPCAGRLSEGLRSVSARRASLGLH